MELGEQWPKLYKSITTKVDDIINHLPRFIKEFKTLGFLSEEDTESLHKDKNVILQPLTCIRSKHLKLKLGLKLLALKKVMMKVILTFLNHPKEGICSKKKVDTYSHERMSHNSLNLMHV